MMNVQQCLCRVLRYVPQTAVRSPRSGRSLLSRTARLAPLTLALLLPAAMAESKSFELMEATVEDVQNAYKAHELTAHQLVQMYLDRIAAYDKKGPGINSIITINPKALEDADKLDAAFAKSGLVGPLHGIPVLVKDQVDAAGMPTTLGSVLLKDYKPSKDSIVTEKLKKAGAIILAKVTLGELGGGDSYGSLYGATHNPYALDRTVGGSSGGTGASVTANFGMIGVGQEGFSSIRRPSAWNSIVGMRPTAGLVSRSGVWGGWPSPVGSLGPMARTVTDLAKLLDVMVGYDADDPVTAYGIGHTPSSYTKFLDKNGLKGARIGVIRASISDNSDPDSEDFKKVDAVYRKSIDELKAAGAIIVDNIVIPDLAKLLATRASAPDGDEALKVYFGRNAQDAPFKTHEEMYTPENIAKVGAHKQLGKTKESTVSAQEKYYRYLVAREQLMTNFLKVMADNKLDGIVHKSVEHSPTLISEGMNPPYVNMKGVIHLNTFLIYTSAMSVPAGFTSDGLPVGITFMGRPYAEDTLLKLAYSYEQATHHRKPPASTPAL